MKRAVVVLLFSVSFVGCSSCRRTNKVETRIVPLEGGASAILPRVPARAKAQLTLSRASLAVGSRTRNYDLVVPVSAPAGKKLSLVLVFHGDGGDAEEIHRD